MGKHCFHSVVDKATHYQRMTLGEKKVLRVKKYICSGKMIKVFFDKVTSQKRIRGIQAGRTFVVENITPAKSIFDNVANHKG